MCDYVTLNGQRPLSFMLKWSESDIFLVALSIDIAQNIFLSVSSTIFRLCTSQH